VTETLRTLIDRELAAAPPAHARAMASDLARRFEAPAAVLFYGSVLRTGDLDGVMDFYVLTERPRRGLRGVAGKVLWPDVSYHEFEAAGRTYRAKVAAMTLAQFQAAVTGRGIDTTIWTRFVQPAALVWSADPGVRDVVSAAVATAAATAARFAAAIGPVEAPPAGYWQALFRQTYQAEFRVEARGRENQILDVDRDRYGRVLTAAWVAGGIGFEGDDEVRPLLSDAERREILRAWRLRRTLGKPLNLARLAKAAFTFEGAARYAAWKIERHTGLHVPLTPWRERHPILASPGVFWRLWQARRRA
jgi:hypothetical protein